MTDQLLYLAISLAGVAAMVGLCAFLFGRDVAKLDTRSAAARPREWIAGRPLVVLALDLEVLADRVLLPHRVVEGEGNRLVADHYDGLYIGDRNPECVALVYDQPYTFSGANGCGGSGWGDIGRRDVLHTRAHTTNAMTLSITSTIDQDASDESFGVDDVVIMIR